MSDYGIGCDAHKLFSLFAVLDSEGQVVGRTKVNHERGAIRDFLRQSPKRTPVALETVGNWYWILDEIEEAICIPAGRSSCSRGLPIGHNGSPRDHGNHWWDSEPRPDGREHGRMTFVPEAALLSVAWLQKTVRGFGPPGSQESADPYAESGEWRARV